MHCFSLFLIAAGGLAQGGDIWRCGEGGGVVAAGRKQIGLTSGFSVNYTRLPLDVTLPFSDSVLERFGLFEHEAELRNISVRRKLLHTGHGHCKVSTFVRPVCIVPVHFCQLCIFATPFLSPQLRLRFDLKISRLHGLRSELLACPR